MNKKFGASDTSVGGDTAGDPFKDAQSAAMNPIIKFTTLFSLLAVEIAVAMTNAAARYVIGGVFFAVALEGLCACSASAAAYDDAESTDDHDDGNGRASATRRAWILPRWKPSAC